jgi:hypothetical protein
MYDTVMQPLAKKLAEALSVGITEDSMAALRKKMSDLTSTMDEYLTYEIKNNLAYGLSQHVVDMASRSIEAMLEGNEEQMRNYLGCPPGGYTGRDRDAAVIHGTLFETGALGLRKKLVEAYRDLIGNERILDLESQVKSLVAQNNKLSSQLEAAQRRFTDYRIAEQD